MSDSISDQNEMKEIVDEFIVEARELAARAIQYIVTMENSPDGEAIDGIFRAVHTIKGASSFPGSGTLSTRAHRSEDILGMVRKKSMEPDHEVADILLRALDLIKNLLDDIKDKTVRRWQTRPQQYGNWRRCVIPTEKGLGEIPVEKNILEGKDLDRAPSNRRSINWERFWLTRS